MPPRTMGTVRLKARRSRLAAGVISHSCSPWPTQIWHITEVSPNSPASAAELEAGTDFIVGTPDILFTEEEDFYTLIRLVCLCR